MSLRDTLAALPGEATLPVSWLRAQLDLETTAGPAPTVPPELDVAAFARLVTRSQATVRSWCERGYIPGAYKLPGRSPKRRAWRIPYASLVPFRQRLTPSSATGAVVVTAETDAEPTSRAQGLGEWRRVRQRGAA